MGKVYETKFYKGTRILRVQHVDRVNGPVVEKVYVDEVAEGPDQEIVNRIKNRKKNFLTK
jgi:hypothetical protein